MRLDQFAARFLKPALTASILLLAGGGALAQQQVGLSAGPTTATLPDGNVVPMWGYTCGAAVATNTAPVATCAPLNAAAAAAGQWSPVIITVPSGQDLQINLTNNLSFATGTTGVVNNLPTSITIVGQIGGGLGAPTYANSPSHQAQGVTWPIANTGPTFTPPVQGQRVQSFATQVAAIPVGTTGTATSLCWGVCGANGVPLRPGTYLIESGTHPSVQGTMGLYGMLVVTAAPGSSTTTTQGTAYPNVAYDAEMPVFLSEIDPALNNGIQAAVTSAGFSETAARVLGGSISGVNIIAGGAGYVAGATINFLPAGACKVMPSATVGSVDSTGAITAVNFASAGSGCSESTTAVASGGSTAAQLAITYTPSTIICSDNAAACYPPVVNYTPTYYLINGAAFDRTHPANSLIASSPATLPTTGQVLVRMVNAGLRMHVPSIVGADTNTLMSAAGVLKTAAAVPGMSLVAEDGNPLPGVPRVQSEVFLAAGKTTDVLINSFASTSSALPVFDRQLSLSGNAVNRDSGMVAYLGVNGSALPASVATALVAAANPDTYPALLAGQSLTISDPAKGVIANDVNVYGVTLLTQATNGVVTLNRNGTFTYVPNAGSTATTDSFSYCANGTVTAGACSSGITATVSLAADNVADTGVTCVSTLSFNANTATYHVVNSPGVLGACTDGAQLSMQVSGAAAGAPLSVAMTGPGAGTAMVDVNGGFKATVSVAGTYTFQVKAANSQGSATSAAYTVQVVFPTASGLTVSVIDGADKKSVINDYRWIIEEDRTFYVDPNCTQNPLPASCPRATAQGSQFNYGTSFHTSFMPVVAAGCTGPLSCESGQTLLGTPVVCDVGNGVCRNTATQQAVLMPGQVALDPKKRYYITVLPGDAANPFNGGYLGAPNCASTTTTTGTTTTTTSVPNSTCGHGMGGAPINKGQTSVMVLAQPSPYPPAKLTAFVFEDDYPLNGEFDAGGGVDVIAAQEPGLGGFQITLQDDAGATGDATGTPTYDMFNQPLSNSLAGTIDPVTNLDACPISPVVTNNVQAGDGTQAGITGMIITCPKYESDGQTLSPLVGQAIVANLYPGRYGVQAIPNADRIARGEEWLQTNTLDGQKAHDSFLRIGEPAYFQEYGPAGYHVSIGFANPKIINERRHNAANSGWCDNGALSGLTNSNGALVGTIDCSNTVTGFISTARMSRTPDERLYGSGDRTGYSFTQCYAALSDPDGATFAFAKCDANGNFSFGPSAAGANDGVPAGNWMLTVFDQWNDQIVDGISTPVGVACPPTGGGGLCTGGGTANVTVNLGEIGAHQWQSDIYTHTYVDTTGTGLYLDSATAAPKPGLPLVATNIRFRDGSFSNFNNTDLTGTANFNEVFPLFNWYVIETDTTRFKTTGVHVVYDAGGPADGTSPGGTPCLNTTVPGAAPCGGSVIGAHLANTYEALPIPADLQIPGAIYCAGADCFGKSIAGGTTGSNVSDAASCTIASVSASTTVSGPAVTACSKGLSTGRIDPPFWWGSYGWQGYAGQGNFLEWGKKPYVPGETGGIHGHVVYASTRPFDDPALLLQNSWEPLVAHVTVNLYLQGVASDGVTPTLTLIDHTTSTSWDDWAQGYRTNAAGTIVTSTAGAGAIPNISCPGQSTSDLFFYGIQNQPQWLDFYNNVLDGSSTAATTQMAYSSQFKCYDGMHTWNQLQPAPYDGMYSFPSITGYDPTTGEPMGTNCTACVTDVDAADPYRYGGSTTATAWANGTSKGMPVLPAGTYVVEVVVPPGYELVKEEDKNILIGDNFIAPATVQFPGLATNVFILPDQAQLSQYYNANNAQNSTLNLGRNTLPNSEGDTGSVETYWPCVGAMRQVPDYISLYPQSHEVAPFAGAVRPLCDRKLITLNDQSSALAKFYIFTSAHIASHFTGIILDDFTSEFDPYSPQFGEKFAPSYLPVSIKDWAGNEISRVYSDQFGLYNGLSYSTWEVNPPNPTGYAPTMMVTCMNDSGYGTTAPWWDPAAVTAGTTSTLPDPFFQTGYSQFCYELSYMPGRTGYFDTPVTPNAAFTDGYNHPDCSYPNLTPAVGSVIGDVAGPWVSAAGHTITINALGDQAVDSYGYSGPSITKAPFNSQHITRHYGFGNTAGKVTIGGVAAAVGSWSDTQLTVTVPAGIPACAVQQQAQFGGSNASCGQLQITTSTNQTSVDSVTVTVGGKKPTILSTGQTIQSAIDAAAPGDMVIVPPGVYNEMLVMWKPLRLQGVGASSSVIDANTQPSAKLLDPWRYRINCLFGLTPAGRPRDSGDLSCAAGWAHATGYASSTGDTSGDAQFPSMVIDRLPFEAVLGWDATLNGNLAEQLIEPSLMGAYEGAAITVLGKGVKFVNVKANPTTILDAFGAANGAAFPANTDLLSPADCSVSRTDPTNRYPTSFHCNPASIDGLGLRDSSQGGGGIYVHGYAHNLQIANNRIFNNLGTLGGGITLGQGEHPDLNLAGAAAVLTPPNSCEASPFLPTNAPLPFCFNLRVNVHNNALTGNSSLGDELFSSTPAGAGGISINTGADYYEFTNNWVCGNLSSGDGGGVSHIGWSKDGTISNNQILFNKTANPSISTNGAGLLIMGAPDVDPTCGANNDQDCVYTPSTVTPSDGTGPGLVVNANLILGNSADAGSGGGVRLQYVNGNDVVNFPNASFGSLCFFGTCLLPYTTFWNSVSLTNNIIVNNVAGWDGAGMSLQDSLYVQIVNNTIAHNDSTATAGPLFGSLFAPMSSAPTNAVGCFANANGVAGSGTSTVVGTASCPQVAGIVSVQNGGVLQANTANTGTNALVCPTAYGGAGCWTFSAPLIFNDLIWQNRSFVVTTGGLNSGLYNQQQVVTLMNADPTFPNAATTANPTNIASQAAIGACPTSGSAYWDIGVRGDTGPAKIQVAGVQMHPVNSALDDLTLYTLQPDGKTAANNVGGTSFNAGFITPYCNGSRTPPEAGGQGWAVPPGTNETFGTVNGSNPLYFSLLASATVDEGNNWINMRWGPLSLTNPINDSATSNQTAPVYLGNYAINSSSGAVGRGTGLVGGFASPAQDYFGNARSRTAPTIGAVELKLPPAQITVSAATLALGNVQTGQAATATVTISNGAAAGSQALVISGITVAPAGNYLSQANNCPAAGVTPGTSCTMTVTFAPTGGGFPAAGTAEAATFTIASNASNGNQAVAASGRAFPAIISYNPNPVAFGNEGDNVTATSTVTVTNSGYGPLYLAAGTGTTPNPRVTGTGFALGTGGTCNATTSYAVGATCTIVVSFDPTSSGGDTGNLRVIVNAYTGATHTAASLQQSSTYTDALSGTGVRPNPSLGSGTVSLGTGATGSTTLTLTNTGATATSPFLIGTISVAKTNNGNATISVGNTGTCVAGNQLAVGATCTIVVNLSNANTTRSSTNATVTVVGTVPGSTAPTYTANRNVTGS